MATKAFSTKKLDNEKAAVILDTAVDVLKATGWCTGSLGDTKITEVDGDGEHCAVGSIEAAAWIHGMRGRSPRWSLAKNEKGLALAALGASLTDEDLDLERHTFMTPHDVAELRDLDELSWDSVDTIIEWNDGTLGRLSPSEGKARLIRRLRKAARLLRKRAAA